MEYKLSFNKVYNYKKLIEYWQCCKTKCASLVKVFSLMLFYEASKCLLTFIQYLILIWKYQILLNLIDVLIIIFKVLLLINIVVNLFYKTKVKSIFYLSLFSVFNSC